MTGLNKEKKATAAGPQGRQVPLAGVWQLRLGAYTPEAVPDSPAEPCVLPGTLDENRKGQINREGNLNRLSRKYLYTGPAVYQRAVVFPADFAGRTVYLYMERTKRTRVWVNGVPQTDSPSTDTLGTPQVYRLSGWTAGTENTLTIEVENDHYPINTRSHMLTEETVTNWNGILGRFLLVAKDEVHLAGVRIYPDTAHKAAAVKLTVCAADDRGCRGTLTLEAHSCNHPGRPDRVKAWTCAFAIPRGSCRAELDLTYPMGTAPRLWSEFDPTLYELTVTLTAGTARDCWTGRFGMRDFRAAGRKFTINGQTTFLRGEANSAVFPLTGYPYMTVEAWREFFRRAQALGINFFRFHSWTPPQAAFAAADELGIYMQPELYAFGGMPYLPEGENVQASAYLFAEAKRILAHLANHPSFVMLAWGNELDTTTAEKRSWAAKLREVCRAQDPTRLYAEGSNNNFWDPSFHPGDDYWTTCKTRANSDAHHVRISFAWVDAASGGHLESARPATDFTYDGALQECTVPVISHEAGQYQVLPQFDREIPQYEPGIFDPRNLRAYRDLMEKKGLLEMNRVFSRVSARISAIGYRADMETALRSPALAGYELLSIQDFPGQGTAHVGILDNFMQEKEGGFPSQVYRRFNGPAVVLGLLPQLVWTTDQTLRGTIRVPNYGPRDLTGLTGRWVLRDGPQVLDSGSLPRCDVPQGQVVDLGSFHSEALAGLKEAKHLTVEVAADGLDSRNCYDIWVYPPVTAVAPPSDVTVCDSWDDRTEAVLAAGGKLLLLPRPTAAVLPGSVPVRWTTDYWSRMFHRADGGAYTMGMYLEAQHPIFREFPTESWSDCQWAGLMKGSRALILDDAPADLRPLAWNIDHMEWSRKLGSLFEARVGAGRVVVCTFDLLRQKDTLPEAAQLYRSILGYMHSEAFAPQTSLTFRELTGLIPRQREKRDALAGIAAANYTRASRAVPLTPADGTSAPAVPELKAGDWLVYGAVDFAPNGTGNLYLEGANAGDRAARVEVRLGGPRGPLAAAVEFQPDREGAWNTQCFPMPRLTGVQDLALVFGGEAALALRSLRFEAARTPCMDAYQPLNPESVAAGVEITTCTADSRYTILQNYVAGITNQVAVCFRHVVFGPEGPRAVAIGGRTCSDRDVSGTLCLTDTAGKMRTFRFCFRADEGEPYELSSETFRRQSFPVEEIAGEQDVTVRFDAGTSFDLESLRFLPRTEPTACR